MKNFAFTLSEFLITIAIIGIVAAITLPVLIGDIHNRRIISKASKFYYSMNQAIYQIEAEYNVDIYDYGTNQEIAKLLGNYLKASKVMVSGDGYKIIFIDGTYLHIHKSGGLDLVYIIDPKVTNANKAKFGTQRFSFIKPKGANKKMTSYCWSCCPSSDRNTLIEQCRKTQSYFYCQKLLERDGWKFKKDNPWKLNKTTSACYK